MKPGMTTARTWELTAAVTLLLVAGAMPITAANKYSSGTKTWDTTTANWGTTSGSYGGATWDNAAPDNAFLEGAAGTVTLGETISIGNLNIGVANYTIDGSSDLVFVVGGNILSSGINVSIRSGVIGSPTVTANQGTNQKLIFAPTIATATLGAVSGGGSIIELAGSTSGNSLVSDSNAKLNVNCTGSWTLAGLASAYEHWIVNGDFIVSTGTLRSNNRAVKLQGGTLHYNNPAAVWDGSSGTPQFNNGGTLQINGGSLDNTSGAAITNSVYNPDQAWAADWTFIGSLGADSDLNIGSGGVLLYGGTRRVTVRNADTTFTVAGVIQDGAHVYGLIKAGDGALELTGVSTYMGDTTVEGGTLSISEPYLSDISAVRIAAGATLDLGFAGNDDVFSVYTNGVLGPRGTWGAPGSEADNETPLISGNGLLNVPVPEPLDGIRYWDGGASDISTDGNQLSEGGDGTWNTSIRNWDAGAGVTHTNWNNAARDLAIFKGTAGTVTLAEDINLGALLVQTAGYMIEGNRLNFAVGGAITNTGVGATITSGITGSPTVAANQGSNQKLIFTPTDDTVTLGAVSGAGCEVVLSGTKNGNSVAGVSNAKVRTTGSGTWTVLGDAVAYEHWLTGGTLIVNGLLRCNNRALHFSGGTLVVNGSVEVAGANTIDMSAGTTLKGTGVINDGPINVPTGANLAPGFPTGTLTITNNGCTINGNLVITIDGLQHGTLAVDGALTVTSATLNVDVVDPPYGPVIIATYTSLSQPFAAINADDFTVDYDYQGGNAIALLPKAPPGTVLTVR